MHNQSFEYRESFVADKLRYHYCDILNSSDILPLMTNKYACYLSYKKFYKREMVGCFSSEDFDNFKLFLSRHSEFMFKPLNEHSGHGIEKVNRSEINCHDYFNSKNESGPFVLEELIEQGSETSLIHPTSVNSCRVATFTIDGVVYILGVTWRIGSGKSIKDNAGSGGMYASVDPTSGIVVTDAIKYNGEHIIIHPDTGIRISGYQLPAWNEAIKLVREMAIHINGTTLIAWDIAYSVKGWLMVEANDNGDWSILQSNKKQGKKAELYLYMDRYFNSKYK